MFSYTSLVAGIVFLVILQVDSTKSTTMPLSGDSYDFVIGMVNLQCFISNIYKNLRLNFLNSSLNYLTFSWRWHSWVRFSQSSEKIHRYSYRRWLSSARKPV